MKSEAESSGDRRGGSVGERPELARAEANDSAESGTDSSDHAADPSEA